MRNVGAAGAQGDAEPEGAGAERVPGYGSLGTGAGGAEGAGAVGSGDEGGAGGESRGPGVVAAENVGDGGRGRQQQRAVVGAGNRRPPAGDRPAARKQKPRGRRGGAGGTSRDQGQGREGWAEQNGGREGADVGGHTDESAGGHHGVHGSGARGAGGRGGVVRAGVG